MCGLEEGGAGEERVLRGANRRPKPTTKSQQRYTGINVLRWRYLWIKRCVDARKRALTERGNTRGGATKKREISRNLLSINLNFSVECGSVIGP